MIIKNIKKINKFLLFNTTNLNKNKNLSKNQSILNNNN
jgi:hypothetical protein